MIKRDRTKFIAEVPKDARFVMFQSKVYAVTPDTTPKELSEFANELRKKAQKTNS